MAFTDFGDTDNRRRRRDRGSEATSFFSSLDSILSPSFAPVAPSTASNDIRNLANDPIETDGDGEDSDDTPSFTPSAPPPPTSGFNFRDVGPSAGVAGEDPGVDGPGGSVDLGGIDSAAASLGRSAAGSFDSIFAFADNPTLDNAGQAGLGLLGLGPLGLVANAVFGDDSPDLDAPSGTGEPDGGSAGSIDIGPGGDVGSVDPGAAISGGQGDTSVGVGNPSADSLGVDAGGGDGGGAASVICTELKRQGLMPADLAGHGAHPDPLVLAGYHLWAIPYVRLMRRSRIATMAVRPLALRWAGQHTGVRPTVTGWIIKHLGERACRVLGLTIRQKGGVHA